MCIRDSHRGSSNGFQTLTCLELEYWPIYIDPSITTPWMLVPNRPCLGKNVFCSNHPQETWSHRFPDPKRSKGWVEFGFGWFSRPRIRTNNIVLMVWIPKNHRFTIRVFKLHHQLYHFVTYTWIVWETHILMPQIPAATSTCLLYTSPSPRDA